MGSSSLRRRALLRLGLAVVLAGVLAATSPAQAQCPGDDGTLPGSQASVTTVATPAATVYVDDRDHLDLDEDGDAGGLWIYLESNGTDGLQRGGTQVAYAAAEPHLPAVPWPPPPITISVGPIHYTLFPCCDHPELPPLGWEDDCLSSDRPDTLLL